MTRWTPATTLSAASPAFGTGAVAADVMHVACGPPQSPSTVSQAKEQTVGTARPAMKRSFTTAEARAVATELGIDFAALGFDPRVPHGLGVELGTARTRNRRRRNDPIVTGRSRSPTYRVPDYPTGPLEREATDHQRSAVAPGHPTERLGRGRGFGSLRAHGEDDRHDRRHPGSTGRRAREVRVSNPDCVVPRSTTVGAPWGRSSGQRRRMAIDQDDQTVTRESTVTPGQPTVPAAAVIETVQTDSRHVTRSGPGGSEMTRRVVMLLFGLIQIVIVLRIVLLLLDARTGNALVSGILDISKIFVAPFEGILNANALSSGGSTLDVAAVVALVGWTILRDHAWAGASSGASRLTPGAGCGLRRGRTPRRGPGGRPAPGLRFWLPCR